MFKLNCAVETENQAKVRWSDRNGRDKVAYLEEEEEEEENS